MKKILCLVLFCLSFFCHAQSDVLQQKSHPFPAKFDFDGVPISQVVRLIYIQAFTTPFVLQPEVLEDSRPVSFRFDSSKGDLHVFMSRFLAGLGYEVETRSGVDYIRAKPKEDAEERPSLPKEVFVYRPKHREGSFLMDLLSPIFKGSFTSKRSVTAAVGEKMPTQTVSAGSAASLIDRDSDVIVFAGSAEEVEQLRKLLDQVDAPTGELLVKAVVYEVQTGTSDGTAFGLAASLLGGKLGINLGPTAKFENSLTIGPASFQAVFSALSSDSRFKVMSTPSVRVSSGKNARFTVGQDVPVLGALSFPQGAGQAVQSVEYHSSGVILDLLPRVRDSVITADVTQQFYNFVYTTTGVNNTPTMIKLELKTHITTQDGDTFLIGGMTQDQDSANRSGLPFLPRFMHSDSRDTNRTELLLVMQINKI